MKKIFKIVLILTVFLNIMPLVVKADDNKTLLDYKNDLKKFEADLAKNQSEINKTQAEIEAANKEIADIKKQVIDMGAEIQQLQEDITKYNEEIDTKDLQTKKIIEYLQLSNGENLYLEYAFGADSITDFIYRMSVVEQVTEHNNKVIDELNDLITASNERKKEINKKEKELNAKEKELGKKVEELGESKSILSSGGLKISDQIKVYNDQIKAYVVAGCKDNDVIGIDCMKTASNGTWRRPTSSGYITSEYGYRWGNFHRAVDIGNKNPYSTKIYSVNSGVVGWVGKDYYGANLVLVWHYDASTNTYYTSNYCHMSTVNVRTGQEVTTNTMIGYMGATGNAQGPHLHLEIFPCRMYNTSDKNCSTWNKYVNFATKMYNQGYKGPRSLIDFPSGTYNSWSSR